MMMTKSKPDESAKQSETSTSNNSNSKKLDAVADLERRLADLTVPEQPAAAAAAASAPAFAMPPPASAAAAAPSATAASGSKNALLARIMAAQERAKQAQGGPPKPQQQQQQQAPPPAFDFLNNNSNTAPPPPPPAFDSSFLPPPQSQTHAPPPPAFDASFLPPPPPQEDSKPSAASSSSMMLMFDPMAARPHVMAPPSAPAFEDLMDTMSLPTSTTNTNTPPVVMPPPYQQQQLQQSSSDNVLDDEALQAILGIEGLTDAEKQEMIAEQIKIMQAIQDGQKSSQVSAADAFEARSFSAAVQSIGQSSNRMQLHGQERTREAIQEGTAIKVQCPSCQNWMQVTGTAQLMFCPVCQTVSPVQGTAAGLGLTAEEAEQMAADARLAEQLQKEEYESAEQEEAQQRQRRESKKKSSSNAAAAPAAASQSQGWMEWLGFGTPAAAPASPAHREIRTTRSTDSTEGLLSGGNVAKPQPHMFACVTDSIGAAVNYATTLPQDEEGNVHGVDASSLLAVTQVGRQQQDDHESNQRYERQLD